MPPRPTNSRIPIVQSWVCLMVGLVVFSSCSGAGRPMLRTTHSVYFEAPVDVSKDLLIRYISEEVGLASVSGHSITTTWIPHEGDYHGILFWKRRWQERSRFSIDYILVTGNMSSVNITVYSQERPNRHYEWSDRPGRQNRATKLVSDIRRNISIAT